MEKKAVYNLDFLVSVKVFDKENCGYLKYYPERKSFWGKREEGFSEMFGGSTFSAADLINGEYYDIKLLVIDNIAYYKPKVKLTFVTGEKVVETFNTYEDALQWGNSMMCSINKQYLSEPK